MRRGRGLRCCGSAGLGDHALAGLLFDWDQGEEALSQPPVSTPTLGAWDTAGGGSASRGAEGESAYPLRALAAAETVPGRGPITQCRLLLGGKQT